MYSWIIWSYPFGTVVEHVSGVPNQEMLSLIKERHGCKLSNYIEWLVLFASKTQLLIAKFYLYLIQHGTEVFKNYEIENKIYHIVRLIKKYHRRIVETKSIPLTHIFKWPLTFLAWCNMQVLLMNLFKHLSTYRIIKCDILFRYTINSKRFQTSITDLYPYSF